MRMLLALHAILLLLASTGFTIVTALFGKTSLQWCYFRFVSKSGWGFRYVSDYSAAEIVIYLLAFAVGAAGFFVALNSRRPVVGGLGVLLSLAGILSFGIEGSHWIVDRFCSMVKRFGRGADFGRVDGAGRTNTANRRSTINPQASDQGRLMICSREPLWNTVATTLHIPQC